MRAVEPQELEEAIKNNQDKDFQIQNGESARISSITYHPVFSRAISNKEGEKGIKCPQGGKSRKVEIVPGETIFFTTQERFCFPNKIFGFVFNRVWGTVRNLQVDTTFIEPGYHGCLRVVVRNNSDTTISIHQDERLCKLLCFCTEQELPDPRVPSDRPDIDNYLNEFTDKRISEKKRKERTIFSWYFCIISAIFILIEAVIYSNASDINKFFSSSQPVISGYIAVIAAPFSNLVFERFSNSMSGQKYKDN
jgi:deoxycytidine triphosphate deaminase